MLVFQSLFWIICSPIKVNNDYYISKNNEVTRSLYFNISSKRENLIRFMKEIGFEGEISKMKKLENVLFFKQKPL